MIVRVPYRAVPRWKLPLDYSLVFNLNPLCGATVTPIKYELNNVHVGPRL